MRERIGGKGREGFVHVSRKRGGGRIEVLERASSSLGHRYGHQSLPILVCLPLSFCIRWRKSVAVETWWLNIIFPLRSVHIAHLPYMSRIVETGQPNGFVEFVACRCFCVEPSEKDRIPRIVFISNFLVKVEAWNVVWACKLRIYLVAN